MTVSSAVRTSPCQAEALKSLVIMPQWKLRYSTVLPTTNTYYYDDECLSNKYILSVIYRYSIQRHCHIYRTMLLTALSSPDAGHRTNVVSPLVIFTSPDHDVCVCGVAFDSQLWENVKSKLLDFHATFVVPALVKYDVPVNVQRMASITILVYRLWCSLTLLQSCAKKVAKFTTLGHSRKHFRSTHICDVLIFVGKFAR